MFDNNNPFHMMELLRSKINNRLRNPRVESEENFNNNPKSSNNKISQKNNILQEISSPFIPCGWETEIKDLSSFIEESKIFNILFYSSSISISVSSLLKYKSVIKSFNQNNDIIIIICILEDDEEDFNKYLKLFSDMKCLVIPFNSQVNDLLTKHFNIITVPRLVILDEKGEIIDSMNNNDLENFNGEIFSGWINTDKILKKSKISNEPQPGDRMWCTRHKHELIFTELEQKSPGYHGGWWCDICNAKYDGTVPNFHCAKCHFDLCENCVLKYKKDEYL